MKFLKLIFAAPLQSWGERAKWDARDTAKVPTKSGVIGMLGCCLGIQRESPELVYLCQQLHMAVRVETPGLLMTDFHTVQTGNAKGFPNAEGGSRSGDTIITPRQYLQDACFTLLLWGNEETLLRCSNALMHPVWVPYLGRKSCVPSKPLIPCWIEADTVDEAIEMDLAGNDTSYAVEIEMLPEDTLRKNERMLLRNDAIINASKNAYAMRKVRASYRNGKGA